MKPDILFLAHRLPYPPNKGDRVRSWHILKALSHIGRVHLIAFADPAEAAGVLPFEISRRCASVRLIPHHQNRLPALLRSIGLGRPASFTYFDSSAFRLAVDEVMARRPIDLVYGFSAQMGLYLPPMSSNVRVVMDFVDCDAGKFDDLASFATAAPAWVYRREARLLDQITRDVANRANLSLFVTQREADDFVARTQSAAAVKTMPNGVDLDYFTPQQAPVAANFGPMILFAGQMDYAPNVDAVQQFAHKVMPRIRQHYPGAMFAIIGRNPNLAVHKLALLPGVRVFGEVIDVRPWLALASCVVAPLRVARGVPNKILEAMAMGRPVVATPIAISGLDVRAGKDLCVAETAEDQAAAILELLDNPKRAVALGKRARARVAAAYDWSKALSGLPHLVSSQPCAVGS